MCSNRREVFSGMTLSFIESVNAMRTNMNMIGIAMVILKCFMKVASPVKA
jgi:hypothetical protein